MRNRFDRQLLELNNELIQMGSLIEQAIEMGYTGQECGRVWIGPFRHDGQEERNYPCSRPGTRADPAWHDHCLR